MSCDERYRRDVRSAGMRWIATSGARYVVGASSYPRHRFSSGFYPFFALSVFPQSKSFWLRASVRAWTGRNGDQREPFQWSCDEKKMVFIEVRHIPTGMVRYDDRSAQATHLRFHWHGITYSAGKLEYRSFAYDRRSTDAPKAEVPRRHLEAENQP